MNQQHLNGHHQKISMNSNENKFEVEKISLDKFQNIKDSITLAKNKSLIKQDDVEENKDDSDDDTKGIKMI